MRTLNNAALLLIEGFESCSLSAYQDVKGVWTIGWGHTGPDVTADTPDWTQEQADAQFRADLRAAQAVVEAHVSAPLNDNQYGALVSLAYNAGAAPFEGTLGRLLDEGDTDGAVGEFDKWDHVRRGGELAVSDGLLRRREAEKALFITPATA